MEQAGNPWLEYSEWVEREFHTFDQDAFDNWDDQGGGPLEWLREWEPRGLPH